MVFRGSGRVACLLMCVTSAAATTVSPMNLPALADHAACVVIGTVLEIEPRWVGDPGTIVSTVTLEGLTMLKATHAPRTLTFTVPGGKLDGLEARIAGAPTFEVGQRWMLFLQPEWKTHPVVGVYRGAFRLVNDYDGVERVQQQGRAVSGLDAEGYVRTVAPAIETILATDAPVEMKQAYEAMPGLETAQFIELITPILVGSRTYTAGGPIGERVGVTHVALPFHGRGPGRARRLTDPPGGRR